MKIVTQFDPTSATFNPNPFNVAPSGIIKAQIPPGEGRLMIFNQSLVNIIVTFQNSAFIDYIPAGTYRFFALSLPNWNISWSGVAPINVQNAESTVSSAFSLVTVVSYELSETIPTIQPATSFINPYDSQLYLGVDIQSTHWSGTAATLFTLNSSTFPGTMTYLQGLWLTTVPTVASSDTGTMEVQITGIGGFGGTFKAYIYSDNSHGANFYPFLFTPAAPAVSPGTAITITGVKVATTGNGFSNTCAVSAQFYHV